VWVCSQLALIAGLRGDEDQCRSLASEVLEQASTRGYAPAAEFARWALLVLELGLGNAARALVLAKESPVTGWGASWTALDRIEAAIRAAEPAAAVAWLDSLEPWAESSGAAWGLAVSAHCRALLCDDVDEGARLFDSALAFHREAARPFLHARTELAFCGFLRRARRRRQAREHLQAALDELERLGAALWAERARAELRASGQTARKRDPSSVDELTAQELQIARLVAEGRTNRDVAAQLFLSPRTVDFHLRNVFRKLDISSRTELARIGADGHLP
jgi:DNA-binding CsgD family transcriptional regulator